MRIIAFVTEAAPIERILAYIGAPTEPPPIAPARGPPAWDDDLGPMPDWDLLGQPEPDVAFDQRVSLTAIFCHRGCRRPCSHACPPGLQSPPKRRRSAFRHLREVRAALG
jgi:hypothetical protein